MKVITFEEYQIIWKKDRKKAINNYGEEYLVKFNHLSGEFWKKDEMLFCSSGKDNHEDVKKEFLKRFPKYEIISISYC